jgi:hypothetical protein
MPTPLPRLRAPVVETEADATAVAEIGAETVIEDADSGDVTAGEIETVVVIAEATEAAVATIADLAKVRRETSTDPPTVLLQPPLIIRPTIIRLPSLNRSRLQKSHPRFRSGAAMTRMSTLGSGRGAN